MVCFLKMLIRLLPIFLQGPLVGYVQCHFRLLASPKGDRRGDSPAWSGRGSRPSRRTSGPSPREDGGFSGVSSSCGTRGGFLTRQDEDLREPLVRCQGSQVSVHVARGSASWLSSHGRGLGPPEALTQRSPDTPGSPEGNTEGPGTASSEPLLPS